MAKTIATLTIEETLRIFRSYGISMSYETLTSLIDGGAVQWAISARRGGAGGYTRKIFRKPLIEWLENLSEEADDDADRKSA